MHPPHDWRCPAVSFYFILNHASPSSTLRLIPLIFSIPSPLASPFSLYHAQNRLRPRYEAFRQT